MPDFRLVSVPDREVVQLADEPVTEVYFPTNGVFSTTTTLPDGAVVEGVTIGDEGMVGVEAFLGENPVAVGETMVEVPEGIAFRMALPLFRRHLAESHAFSRLLGSYVQVVLAQLMQSAACNARHQVRDRCAKWLLLTHDRVHSDELRVSHVVLSMMLGTTRPTVTVVAGELEQAGLIKLTYGRITVLDRKGLEAAACSCYAAIRNQFDHLAEQRF